MAERFDAYDGAWKSGEVHKDGGHYNVFTGASKTAEIHPDPNLNYVYNLFSYGSKTGEIRRHGDRYEVYDGTKMVSEIYARGDHYDVYDAYSSTKTGEIRRQQPDFIEEVAIGIAGGLGTILAGVIGAMLEGAFKSSPRAIPYDPAEPIIRLKGFPK